ncbi:hypothetical protein [Paenibacillus sp. ACRRY]|nr:hypothetical protein [Paenibacillus sp. ACRRY]
MTIATLIEHTIKSACMQSKKTS